METEEQKRRMKNEHISSIQIDKTKQLMLLWEILKSPKRYCITKKELEKNPDRAYRLLLAQVTGNVGKVVVKGMTFEDLKRDKILL